MLFVIIFFNFISISYQKCNSKVYCNGDFLHTIQMAGLYSDSKTFVDLKMIFNETTIIENFNKVKHESNKTLTKSQIKNFIDNNFENKSELSNWSPPDFKPYPKFILKIKNQNIQDFALKVINIIPQLAKKVNKEVLESPEFYSILAVPNGFIIPGGRFREFYYWDSFWIIKGLLLCEMFDTTRGMLDNFIILIQKYGFIPNGARKYYLNRSHPPMLTLMAAEYFKKTQDIKWLQKNIKFLEIELNFFLNNRKIKFYKNGKHYILYRYFVKENTPRPESYQEDFDTASQFSTNKEKSEFYQNIRSAAESGWDFSSRWFIDKENGNTGDLKNIQTKHIIPVDLNAFIYANTQILSYLHQRLSNKERSSFWKAKAQVLQEAIHEVLYDNVEGIWLDVNAKTGKHRRYFYPSNLTPLWVQAYNSNHSTQIIHKIINYLKVNNINFYKGGIPTSLYISSQQWDLPNAWAPLQQIIIEGLYRTDNLEAKKMAEEFARNWVLANYKSYEKFSTLFEKYDARYSGQAGSGGEYEVQTGFGWSIGVILDLINTFYTYNNFISKLS